jgi:hypothetical protein
MRAMITDGTIGLDYRSLSADVTLTRSSKWLVLPVVNLPLDNVIAALAQHIQGRVLDLLRLHRILVVLELVSVLVLLPTLLQVPLLR